MVTTMHRCLEVPELLNHIFHLIKLEPGGDASLAALARTAKCFQDPALDTLWKTQGSLEPLMRCFPAELLKKTRQDGGLQQLMHPDGGSPQLVRLSVE